ncbi:MAG: hypothetical protein HY788_07940 [Deltaproteobacteria bacterium]|nr:hypothetical protein [Deltaproteobacteria bacterium]
MRQINIILGGAVFRAEPADTSTADKIWEALPIECAFNTWGDEMYYSIPVEADLDSTAREVVELGDLGYWPSGNAFCIFFGATPMSRGDEIRPASAVNVVGKTLDDPKGLRAHIHESGIRIEAG